MPRIYDRIGPIGLAILALVLLILVAVFVISPLFRDGTEAAQQNDLSTATQQYVEQRGETYAGPCADTIPGQHIGMWCSEVTSQTANEAVVEFGPTFSQFDVRVTFERDENGWQVANEEPIAMPDALTYTVQEGETLFSIAQSFDATPEQIMEANDIDDPGAIAPGQTLLIPTQQPNEREPAEPGLPVCLTFEDDFVAGGEIASIEADAGDARQVMAFRLGAHEGCERVVIDLATPDGDEASQAGPLEAEFLEGGHIIRIHLLTEPGLDELTNTVTDAELGGEFVDRVYFVRSLDGETFIDVHLTTEVSAYVFTLEDPARIVLDVKRDVETAAAFEDNVVVVTPRAHGDVTYPIEITGYARTFEANVVAILRVDGKVVAETFTTAASWAETWGEFELQIEDGPVGEVELFVGEHSAKDGTEQGVYIPLTIE